MNIAEELFDRVDFEKTEGVQEVEFECEDIIYHMEYEYSGRKSIECSLTTLKYNESNDDYVAIENNESNKIEKDFIWFFEKELRDAARENNGGLDPAFRSWEEVNRMCY